MAFSFMAMGATAAESGNAEALETITRLRSIVWGDLLYPEFKSAEDTYAKAREALARKEFQEAERLFRMTILKGAILERKALEANLAEPVADDSNDFSRIVGDDFFYTVRQRDTVRLIAAKFGVSSRNILRLNNLKKGEQLRAGQKLRIVTRRIVPKEVEQGIVINIPDRTMYLFRDGRLESMYPVAVGKPSFKDKKGWHTPTGNFRIVAKLRNPVWRVPSSIQDEMKSQGREVLDEVPPGDANPLGRYALRTSIPGILIHGTNTPASIYGFSSHGCIRVYPDHMEQLYRDVTLRTSGEIVYKPVKLAQNDDGRIFLEVHPDVYDKVKNLEVEAWKVITGNNANGRVDWAKVMKAVNARSGMPEDVTLGPRTHSQAEKITSLAGK
ncbi:L,D-transpeptidase family protein [Citrifermentans pelophilum]|uniref:L,D-transpeptidase family protein n=1 Tax=Geoanaerobacter pelophilus TaxID=60036 RepID=UPI001BD9316B|nr:L,D-transpeptidase family protein [Geoanaerobacter pelophilus]